MARLKYKQLEKSVTSYRTDELIAIFGTKDNPQIDKAKLFRSLVMNELDHSHADGYRSLRNFWYHPIKPILSKLGYLEKESDDDDPGRRLSQDLSDTIGELVKNGILTYRDLYIVDNSRQMTVPSEEMDEPYVSVGGYQVRGRIYPNIILAVEKDTAYATIEDLADFIGCSAISGKGQDALAAMEKLLYSARDDLYDDEPIYIATITDYDPSGYSIANTFIEQAHVTAANLGIANEVRTERLGINVEQLSETDVDNYRYMIVPSKKREKQAQKWLEETGGIDGELYGLELDALTNAQMRDIFITGIAPLVDETELVGSNSKRAYLADIVGAAIEPIVVEVVDQVYNEYGAFVERRNGRSLFDLARAGRGFPTASGLFNTDYKHEIRQAALRLIRESA